ncbi:MAG: saccharopine dehydrogenase C-terminal domain-containing protein, partial [bacterium]|nr:saccharopine dehydrogenase C-terminal domain-containing protein [bacterium]
SYCGGLVANNSDGDNPWKYKFSWNPRNVVLAGAGAPALFLKNNELKLVPYHQLFKHIETFEIENAGSFEAYANRDSLKYMALYNLEQVSSMKRGTLRKKGYAAAWQVIVELGLTDDSIALQFSKGTTLSQWLATYLPNGHGDLKTELRLLTHCGEDEIAKLEWLGLFGHEKLPLISGTSAQILEEILKPKWHLSASDKDLIVMLHKIGYMQNGIQYWRSVHMTLEGESDTHTAMAKTVGLPLAIACKLILENKIQTKGVLAPVTEEFYEPVLKELENFGIYF